MKFRIIYLGVTVLVSIFLAGVVSAAPPPTPQHISYQGELVYDGTPFSGEARFKFALVDSAAGNYFWSNDGTRGEPSDHVNLNVNQGLFSVLLGASPMVPIDPRDLDEFLVNQALRIWVDIGDGFVLLGDQPLSSTPFALRADHANSADSAPGSFTAQFQIYSVAGGFKFPDGTIQTTAATGGGGGGNTLDMAYDQGGPGLGRTIVTDSGAVNITGTGGLVVEDDILIGKDNPYSTWVAIKNIGVSDTTRVLSFGRGGSPSFFFESGFDYNQSFEEPTFKFDSAWYMTEPPLMTMTGFTRRVGIGVDQPWATLHLKPGNWDLDNSNGDFLIGDSSYRFKIGVANSGGGAGNVHMRSMGGTHQLIFGGGTNDVLWVNENGIKITEGAFQVNSSGQVDVIGDFGSGAAGTALYAENTNAGGIALWAKTSGTDATAIIQNMGTGDLMRGFQGTALKFRVLNTGRVVTPSLLITGGADLTESFDVSEGAKMIEPGSVLVIDPENPGQLALSRVPYDTRVAGVVSGAGGVNPGLTLTQEGILEGAEQVALTGRVYVRASNENGPIRPGDMITTSSREGIAMRANDRERAFGAVLGKAMTELDEGDGLVLVLIGLQ